MLGGAKWVSLSGALVFCGLLVIFKVSRRKTSENIMFDTA